MNRQFQSRLAVPVSRRDHICGSLTAPVTIVEYGDYECRHCGEAYVVMTAIRQRMANTICFVFRNFPLSTAHPHAQHAAEAAEAAGAQRKFWEMHRVLFENQDALDDDNLVQYAAALDLNVQRFVNELAGHVHARRVREDFLGGVRSGVNGTPTFFVNDVRHDGGFDANSLIHAIESHRAWQTDGSH